MKTRGACQKLKTAIRLFVEEARKDMLVFVIRNYLRSTGLSREEYFCLLRTV